MILGLKLIFTFVGALVIALLPSSIRCTSPKRKYLCKKLN